MITRVFENASKRKTVITADNNANYQYKITVQESHLITHTPSYYYYYSIIIKRIQ